MHMINRLELSIHLQTLLHYTSRLTIPHHEAQTEQETLLHTSRDWGTLQTSHPSPYTTPEG